MAITSKKTDGVENTRLATIAHLDDAGTTAGSYKLGFKPRYVCAVNATDRTKLEWYEGMASATSLSTTAAGATTLITSAGITVAGDTIGFPVLQSKQFYVLAEG